MVSKLGAKADKTIADYVLCEVWVSRGDVLCIVDVSVVVYNGCVCMCVGVMVVWVVCSIRPVSRGTEGFRAKSDHATTHSRVV